MIIDPVLLFGFELANLIISVAFLDLALRIIPRSRVRSRRTRAAGAGFFALAAANHLDLAMQAVFNPGFTLGGLATSWHMVTIHALQALCIIVFMVGMFTQGEVTPEQDT